MEGLGRPKSPKLPLDLHVTLDITTMRLSQYSLYGQTKSNPFRIHICQLGISIQNVHVYTVIHESCHKKSSKGKCTNSLYYYIHTVTCHSNWNSKCTNYTVYIVYTVTRVLLQEFSIEKTSEFLHTVRNTVTYQSVLLQELKYRVDYRIPTMYVIPYLPREYCYKYKHVLQT